MYDFNKGVLSLTEYPLYIWKKKDINGVVNKQTLRCLYLHLPFKNYETQN